MKTVSEDELKSFYLEQLSNSNVLKIVGFTLISVGGLLVLGYLFKIVAHTVRGYKELKHSFMM